MKCREAVGWLVDWMASMKKKIPKLCTVHPGTQASNCGSQDSCGVWLSLSFAFWHYYCTICSIALSKCILVLPSRIQCRCMNRLSLPMSGTQEPRSQESCGQTQSVLCRQTANRQGCSKVPMAWPFVSSSKRIYSILWRCTPFISIPCLPWPFFFASNTLPGGKRMFQGDDCSEGIIVRSQLHSCSWGTQPLRFISWRIGSLEAMNHSDISLEDPRWNIISHPNLQKCVPNLVQIRLTSLFQALGHGEPLEGHF